MQPFVIRTVLCAVLLVAGPAGPRAAALDRIRDAHKLVVGALVDFLPFGLLDQSGAPAGADIDFARMMGKALGVDVEIVQTTAPNRIPYLLSGKVDIALGGMSITPERAKAIDFSRPYSAIELSVYAPAGKPPSALNEMAGLSVSTGRGTVVDTALTALVPRGTRIVRFDDDASAVQAYRNGQVDAIGLASVFARELVKAGGFDGMEAKFPIRSFYVAAGFRKGDDDVRAWVDGFIAQSIENGQLNQLNLKWFGTALPQLPSDPTNLPSR